MAGQLTAEAAACAPTAAEWRAAMSYFPTGVTIVTSWCDGAPVGATVNAFCSVSLEPPLLLVCLAHENPLCAPVRACGVFGINILPHEDGRRLALRFARDPEAERFDGLAYRSIGAGAPQLDVAPVFVDCRLEAEHAAGDHVILIGRGIRADHASSAAPLLYHRSVFPDRPLLA
jgi:flavin reductase (DIM6/NTAB) family NADH-FMN oxidoreductase RutF